MSAHSILVFGSINIDMTNRVSFLPKAGETIHAQNFTMGLGGKGANQAVAASKLELPVKLAGWIGNDVLGQLARQTLLNTSVDLQALNTHPTAMTGIASININEVGENTIIVAGGSNMSIEVIDVELIKNIIETSALLMMQLEVPMPAILHAARIAKKSGTYVLLDPAPVPNSLPDELFQLANVMTPNETETEKLTGIRPIDFSSAQKAGQILLNKGIDIAVIKMGAKGVYYFSKNENGFMPPYKVNVVDTVAAGDSFNAGLATGLARCMPLSKSISLAAACGALSTTKKGASSSSPKWSEVMKLMHQQDQLNVQIL